MAESVTTLAKLPKARRERAYEELWAAACERGSEKVAATRPEPMTVVQRANPLDDSSPVVKRYAPVADGVCGFAWVTVSPGGSSFARWLTKTGKGRRGYYGGIECWAPNLGEYGQSYELKQAWAQGVAERLQEAGIKAYAGGRLD